MRIENTLRNAKYNFMLYFASTILGFISRSFLIRLLGIDIVGINSVMGNLLGFLNVAEMGISVAITYSLYKPLAKNDNKKIGEIMSLFRYYYRRIAIIVLILGLILSLFLKFLVKSEISLERVYIYYYLFLVNAIITYLFSSRLTLIIADQKQYLLTVSGNVTKLLKVAVQIILLLIFRSYIIWIIIEIISNSCYLIYTNKWCKKTFNKVDFKKSYDIKKIKSENKRIMKDLKDVFLHKIANVIAFQTDGLLIAFFLNLRDVGIYGNYLLIISSLAGIFTTGMNSVTASIGNLVAEGSREKVYDMFKKMYLIENYFAMIIVYILYYTINQFMDMWVGRNLNFSNLIVLVLMINLYIQISRATVDRFRETNGVFWDIYAPVVEGGLNLIISVMLIGKMGVLGILIGTLVSNIVIVLIWKPYTVYKYVFKMNISKYVINFLQCTLTAIVAIFISNFIRNFLLSIIGNSSIIVINFIINIIVSGLVITVVGTLLYLLQKDYRKLVKYILGIFLKK